jgi:ribosomal protein S18 acetylase RimI-like enzyme
MLRFEKLTTVEQMLPHYHIMRQLNHGYDEQGYAALLTEMIPKGYSQIAAFEGDTCVGLTGIWISVKLYCGWYVELDNVIIDENHRDKGVGEQLCRYAEEEAKKLGCRMAMLDCYVENYRGQRFYYRHGYIIRGFHMLKKLR